MWIVHVISMEFLCLFRSHHFLGKPPVASRNIGCFSQAIVWHLCCAAAVHVWHNWACLEHITHMTLFWMSCFKSCCLVRLFWTTLGGLMPFIPHQGSCFPLFTTIRLKKESCRACKKKNWLMNVLPYNPCRNLGIESTLGKTTVKPWSGPMPGVFHISPIYYNKFACTVL